MEWIVQLPILFFSIIVHEVSHGWMALRHGDDTARTMGRLSFNPAVHVDPIGTLVLPALCLFQHWPMIGWAKPVPVNPHRLRGGRWPLFLVAAVGPVSNIILSFGAALLFKSIASMPAFFPQFQGTMLNALFFAVSVNIFLAFFNLLPVHPLDGSKVLSSLLPPEARLRYERHIPYGFAIIIALIALGLIRPLITKPSLFALGFLARLGLIW